eukprot:gene5972-8227_t
MGGGVSSPENQRIFLEQLDATVGNNNTADLASAYREIQRNIKAQSLNSNLDGSIPFLAIRQLSQNLKDNSEEGRNKAQRKKRYLKSRSVPNNILIRERINSFKLNDKRDEKDSIDISLDDHISSSTINVATSTSVVEAAPTVKKIRKKPALSLEVNEDDDETNNNNYNNHDNYNNSNNNDHNHGHGLVGNAHNSSVKAMLSPRGTLLMGHLKIRETGIFPNNSSINNNDSTTDEYRLKYLKNNNNNSIIGKNLPALGGKKDFIEIGTLGSGASGVVTEAIHVPSLTIVAIKMLPVYNDEKRQHVARELTVLYKNLSDLQLIDDSLSTNLWSNLSNNNHETQENNNNNNSHTKIGLLKQRSSAINRCPNVLSLYNAFLDPKSGMINLVIEYMDGGSLEDLVRQGGCTDERVIADIAYQAINALDSSFGFAKSFVGTVCYMSPERITGETYSYPSDVWSLGLTLLAVAKGKFPLSGQEDPNNNNIKKNKKMKNNSDTPSPDGPIGGPGGYWAMIKAICDEESPLPGPTFSPKFNSFIEGCLRKDASDRLSTSDLVRMPFILDNVDSKIHPKITQLRENYRKTNSKEQLDFDRLEDKLSDLPKLTCDTSHSTGISIHTDSRDSNIHHTTSTSTPLSSRLTSAIVRRGSKDINNSSDGFPTPSKSDRILTHENMDNGIVHHHLNPVEELDEIEYNNLKNNKSLLESDIIKSIRLAHLDRVLERIYRKIRSRENSIEKRLLIASSSIHADAKIALNDSDSEDSDDSDLDQDERDFDNVQSYMDDANNNDSYASLDKFLYTAPKDELRLNRDDIRDENDGKFDQSFGPTGKSILKSTLNDDLSSSVVMLKSMGGATSFNRSVHFNEDVINNNNNFVTKNGNEFKLGGVEEEDEREFSLNKKSSSPPSSLLRRRKIQPIMLNIDDEDNDCKPIAMSVSLQTITSQIQSSKIINDLYPTNENKITKQLSTIGIINDTNPLDNSITKLKIQQEQVVMYRSMLPKFDSKGIVKWDHLADQLHLPINLVKIAACARLGTEISLEE